MIPFNKPFVSGHENKYIQEAIALGKLSGDGSFTKKCQTFFEKKYGFNKCLLTTSCTDALEMAALLIDIQPGDEVIIPSYTFVSSANPFILRGAKVIFADSRNDLPGIDEDSLETLITPKTKAIVPVHYAGVACDMHKILLLAKKYNLFVIEDAAQSVDSYYTFPDGTKKPLGSMGALSAFSFHDTKNITCGEGGMLVINETKFVKKAEIIREKGTNRSAFFRGEVDKYGWVSIGSSFLPSELLAAFLWAQLQEIEAVHQKRRALWNRYYKNLEKISSRFFQLPCLPAFATNNGHIFYIVFKSQHLRNSVIEGLKRKGISAVFHYVSLHKSQYFSKCHDGRFLKESEKYSDCLLRLPLFFDLTYDQVDFISTELINLLDQKSGDNNIDSQNRIGEFCLRSNSFK